MMGLYEINIYKIIITVLIVFNRKRVNEILHNVIHYKIIGLYDF